MFHDRRLVSGALVTVLLAAICLVPIVGDSTGASAAPARSAAGNLLTNGSFEGSSMSPWQAAGGFAARTYADPVNAHDGQWLANGYTAAAGGSVFQDVAGALSPDAGFVGSLWVRSSDGSPFSGSLALFGLGGSDADVTYFTAGAAWTQVQVPLDVHSGSDTAIRFQMYAYTVGHNISFDGADLVANALTNGSFEGSSMAPWQAAGGFAARSYHDAVNAHDGQWLANGYTASAGGSVFQDVPVGALSPGAGFVGSLWVRSADGSPFSGSLALFGLGGSDGDATFFTAGAAWSQVQVPLDVHSGSDSAIRFQMYAYTVGHNISFDGADLVANALTNGSFEGSSMAPWQGAGGFAARSYHDAVNAHDGQWLANGYTASAGGSVFQDVVEPLSPGASFVGSLWVRSSDGSPFSGSLALFGLGGSDADVTYFTAGAAWSRVQVPLDVHSGSESAIRFQMYAYTVGHNISFDGAQLSGSARSSLAANAATATSFALSRAGTAGYTLIDNATGQTYAGGAATTVIASASVIKVPIAMTLMQMVNAQGRGLTASESSALNLMITQSDNNAATQLWNEVGGPNVIALMRNLGATSTSEDPGGAWGFTATTSHDLAVVLAQLADGVLGPSATNQILTLMHEVIPSQAWGIDAALPGSAIKNGWYPDPNDWRVNCLGIIAGSEYSLAIMTEYPIGLGQGYGEQTCQGIAADLLGNVPGAAAARVQAPALSPRPPTITGRGMTSDGG